MTTELFGSIRLQATSKLNDAGDLTAWCFHGSDELGKPTPGDLGVNLMTQASNSSADRLFHDLGATVGMTHTSGTISLSTKVIDTCG